MKNASVMCVKILLMVSFSGMIHFKSQDARAGYYRLENEGAFSTSIAMAGEFLYFVGNTTSYSDGYGAIVITKCAELLSEVSV